MKKLLSLFIVYVAFSCSQSPKQEEPYVPSDEMKPAYTVITDAIKENELQKSNDNVDYDLEETVRILNSLEIA